MVLADSEFTRRLRRYAENDSFSRMFRVSDAQQESQKDIEYLVRLVVHVAVDFEQGMDVQEFLSHGILDVISKNIQNDIFDKVERSLDLLQRAIGEDALIPPEDRAEGIAARFSLRALEGIAVGIARNYPAIAAMEDPLLFVRNQVEGFWQQQEVVDMSAAGLRGTVRLQRSVPFGVTWFDPNVQS